MEDKFSYITVSRELCVKGPKNAEWTTVNVELYSGSDENIRVKLGEAIYEGKNSNIYEIDRKEKEDDKQ